MLPHFPAGAGTREMGSKRKGKRGQDEFLERKHNQPSADKWGTDQIAFSWALQVRTNLFVSELKKTAIGCSKKCDN